MDQAEFDKFADEYHALHAENIRASGERPEFFAAYKVRDVAARCAAGGLAVGTILDFGGGTGSSAPHFAAAFPEARIEIADVSERSLDGPIACLKRRSSSLRCPRGGMPCLMGASTEGIAVQNDADRRCGGRDRAGPGAPLRIRSDRGSAWPGDRG